MVAILDFRSEQFQLCLFYKSCRCFLPSFKSTGLSVLDMKRKIDLQDGGLGGYLGFPIFALFNLQVTSMLLTKFQVNWLFVSGGEAKNRFLRFLNIYDPQVTPILPTKFQSYMYWSSGIRGVGF